MKTEEKVQEKSGDAQSPRHVPGGVRTSVAAAAEALEVDKQVAWYLLKVLGAVGVARRDGKEKVTGTKVSVDVYVLAPGWQDLLVARLSGLR